MADRARYAGRPATRHVRGGRPRALLAVVSVLVLTAVLAGSRPGPAAATAAAPPAYAGYLFVYFTGEGTPDGEQVRFGLSEGNDPLHWRQLAAGAPVLTSTVGTRGVRDPFIVRSPAGDRFYLIGTDMRQYGSTDWDTPLRHGSRSIVIWESTDLVRWTGPRLAQVSPATAGNTWAPEAVYDDSLGRYVVFWSSTLYPASDPGHTGASYNRLMYATTTDFRTFSAAQVWQDPGYSVIDATMIRAGDTWYRFSKDERNSTSSSPCSKFILQAKASTVTARSYAFVAECLGRGSISRGEGPLVFKSNTAQKWYLFIDEFGARGYVPFETADLASGAWTRSPSYTMPGKPRHGTVLSVTQAEYDRLLRTYG